jgi:hypothetical protein
MNTFDTDAFTSTFQTWTSGTQTQRLVEPIVFWKDNIAVNDMVGSMNVVGCEWTAETIKIYWNGVMQSSQPVPRGVVTNPVHLLLTTALQPFADPGHPFDFSTLPSLFTIDYVVAFGLI